MRHYFSMIRFNHMLDHSSETIGTRTKIFSTFQK